MTMNESAEYPWAAEPYRWLCISQFVANAGFTKFRLPDPRKYNTRAEIADMKGLFAQRAARLDAIKAQATDIISPFQAVVPFTKDRHTNVHELATMLKELGRYLVMYYKDVFERPRPDSVDSSVAPVIPVPGHPAYPSGHSLQSHLIAHGLTSLFPNAQKAIFAVAQEIAFNRQVAGVHYESDTTAGKDLASQAWPIISDSGQCPAIAKIMLRARQELLDDPV